MSTTLNGIHQHDHRIRTRVPSPDGPEWIEVRQCACGHRQPAPQWPQLPEDGIQRLRSRMLQPEPPEAGQ